MTEVYYIINNEVITSYQQAVQKAKELNTSFRTCYKRVSKKPCINREFAKKYMRSIAKSN